MPDDGSRQTFGSNNGPDDATALRERLTERHAGILARADELLAGFDRAPLKVDDEETARKFVDFESQFSAALKSADAAHKGEKEPFLVSGKLVDGFFNFRETLKTAKDGIRQRRVDYQRRVEAEERRKREAEERAAREEAERKRRAAEEAAKALESTEDLNKAVDAEEDARRAEADAARAAHAAHAKPAEMTRLRGDLGGVASLRKFWTYKDLDRKALDLDTLRPFIPQEALERAIKAYIATGARELTGVTIFEDLR